MDSLSYEAIGKLISEALKQSPHNPQSNGFGFGLAIVVTVGAVCVVGFVLTLRRYERYRDRQDARRDTEWKDTESAREQARQKLFDYFTAEFAESRKFFGNELDEIEKSFAPDREKIQAHDKIISRLEWQIEQLMKKENRT